MFAMLVTKNAFNVLSTGLFALRVKHREPIWLFCILKTLLACQFVRMGFMLITLIISVMPAIRSVQHAKKMTLIAKLAQLQVLVKHSSLKITLLVCSTAQMAILRMQLITLATFAANIVCSVSTPPPIVRNVFHLREPSKLFYLRSILPVFKIAQMASSRTLLTILVMFAILYAHNARTMPLSVKNARPQELSKLFS